MYYIYFTKMNKEKNEEEKVFFEGMCKEGIFFTKDLKDAFPMLTEEDAVELAENIAGESDECLLYEIVLCESDMVDYIKNSVDDDIDKAYDLLHWLVDNMPMELLCNVYSGIKKSEKESEEVDG